MKNYRGNSGRKPAATLSTVIEYVRTQDCLQKWAHLTLRERSAVILKELNLKISVSQLHRLYHRQGIHYTCPQSAYSTKARTLEQLNQNRNLFAKLLASRIVDSQPLIYVDETTFNCWMRNSKTW